MKTILRVTAASLLTAGLSHSTATSADASTPKWLSISEGSHHTCAIRTNHAIYCWGEGELGNGTYDDAHTAKKVGTPSAWKVVSAGYKHTCGIDASGYAYCWGNNSDDQLGDGDDTRTAKPTPTKITQAD